MKITAPLFIFSLTLSLVSFGSDALAKNGWPKCPSDGRNVTVYAESSKGKLTYYPRFNARKLQNMGRGATGRLGPLWIPTGLTVADENYRLKTNSTIYDLGNDRYCAVLNSVNLFIGYKDIKVFISDKYRKGSCEYHSILDHENLHVRFFRDTLHRHSMGIKKALHKQAPRIGPVYVRNPKAASQKLQSLMDAKIKPMFTRMSRDISRRNASIDTRANYKREQAKCSNW